MAKEAKKPQDLGLYSSPKPPNNFQKKPSLDAYKEETRKRAEEVYKQRAAANKPGDTLSDWLQAEQDIKKKYGL
jgi:hypothetical protein